MRKFCRNCSCEVNFWAIMVELVPKYSGKHSPVILGLKTNKGIVYNSEKMADGQYLFIFLIFSAFKPFFDHFKLSPS